MKLFLENYWVNFNKVAKYSTGVYKIYHVKDKSKLYIGSASSTNKYGCFSNRFRRHLYDLFYNKHCNARLQNYCNKYGLSGLRFEIIEICESFKCIEREQYYFNILLPYFNIAKTAGNTLGVRPTYSQLCKRGIPILQYNLDGDFIKEYPNATIAFRNTGVKQFLIHQCCRSKLNPSQSKGFQWRFKKSDVFPIKIDKYFIPTAYRLICYDKSGKFISEFNSMLEASNLLKIPVGNISKHLNGKTSVCYGKIFKLYYNNYPLNIESIERIHKNQIKVIIKDLNTNIITEYPSFRSVPGNIIGRCTLKERNASKITEFIHKNRYKIQLQKLK